MSNKFGCLGSIALLFTIGVIFIAGLFLQGWIIQVIYNWGLTPLLSHFEVYLPTAGYWTFFYAGVVLGTIKAIFTSKTNSTLEKINEVDTVFEVIWFLISKCLGIVCTNLISLGIMYMLFWMVF